MQKLLSVFSVLCFVQLAYAQNNNSPYSIIGIGAIEQSYFDRSSGMASAAISLASSRFLFHANPASYAKLDDHFFSMEVAMRYKSVVYEGTGVDPTANRSADFAVEKVALAMKMKSWWGTSVGLMPYSSSNYSFMSTKDVQGSALSSNAYYEGTGGMNLAYIANAFKLGRHFRIGLQTNILFGNFTQKETLYTDELGLTSSPIITSTKSYTSKIQFKGGAQYSAVLNKKLVLNLGVVASHKTYLNSNDSVSVSSGGVSLAAKEIYTKNFFALPNAFGAGASIVYKQKFTFSADYKRDRWSDLNLSGYKYQLVNDSRVAVGFEYAKRDVFQEGYAEKYYLQAGAYYGISYINVNGQQLKNMGISFGLGFNSKRSPLGVMINAEVGRHGTSQYNLVKENYVQLGVTFTYRDFWYTKMKRYSY